MSVTLDGDLTALGFRVEDDAGLDDGVDATFPTANPGGVAGQLVVATRPLYAPRKASVTFVTKQTSLAALQTALDALKGRLSGTGVVLTSVSRPGRTLTVRADGAPRMGSVANPKYLGPEYLWRAMIGVVADNPFWRDTADSTVGSIGAAAVALPQGTGPTMIDVDIGPGVNPDIIMADADGNDVLRATAVHTIAAGDLLRISRSTQRVEKRVSGVWSDAWTAFPNGFDYFEARASWFDYPTSDWPTLRNASGAAIATATYAKRWA